MVCLNVHVINTRYSVRLYPQKTILHIKVHPSFLCYLAYTKQRIYRGLITLYY